MVTNQNDDMKLFADNLWEYFQPMLMEKLEHSIGWFRATVTANPGSGKLKIQRPFDDEFTVKCTSSMSGASVGDNVLVFTFGENLGTNAIVVGNADGSNMCSANLPLSIENGGTGETTVAAARNALGLGNTSGALPIANGGTGATTSTDALTNLVTGVFSRFSDSTTTTTEGQNSNVKTYTAVGDGLIFVSITCRRDSTSNSYGTWNAEIAYDGTIWAKQLNRFGSAQNLDFAVNAAAFIPVTNGKQIVTTMGSTFTGTKRFIYNVIGFGCSFTIS